MSAAPPPSGPHPASRRGRRGGVVWPLVLIFVGGVFLLENTGYLPPSTWFNLWRLWPLLLVLIGIELLLANHIPRTVLAVMTGALLVVGLAVTTFGGIPGLSRTQTPSVTSTARADLGAATQAAVMVRFGGGQLEVGPLVQPDSNELASTTFEGPPDLALQPLFSPDSAGSGQLDVHLNGRSGPAFLPFLGGSDSTRLDLDLNPGVPIPLLTVQIGATDAHVDLSNLQVRSLEMSVGATAAELRLPQTDGTTTAHISSGMSTLTVDVPQGLAAQIRYRGGLSTIDVDSTRFPPAGSGMYRSPDYATAQKKVDLTLESGPTTIQVR